MDPAQEVEAAALAKQRPMLEAMAQAAGNSDVQRFYKNSVIFLTGGSGFLGKSLLEKLFRTCQISKVFILLRAKKGKNIQSRINDMFEDPIFSTLKAQHPNFVNKIIAVEGDVSEIRLGIKDDAWKILTEEVDVIFHVAATTRFDEPLEKATLINVRGTREALLLGRACKKLRSYVHVSTAYSNATVKTQGQEVPEEFYTVPILPDTLISMAETMDPKRLSNITPSLIADWPNTYTFTKLVAEELVRETSAGLPICITRPGIVVSTYREPAPGWLDMSCIFGASGFIYGSGLGLLHTSHAFQGTVVGLVPCDYVTNATIVAAKETATNQKRGGDDTKIYTVNATHRNPVLCEDLFKALNGKARCVTSNVSFYYCFGSPTSSRLWYLLVCIFLQYIPAFVADTAMLLMGKERQFYKMADKVFKMCNTLSYFLTHEWDFNDDNTSKLYSDLSKEDQAIFNFDITNIDWNEFMLIWCIGIRKYIVKDGLRGTAQAIRKQKYLRVLHYIFMTIYLYIYCIYKLINFVYFCVCQLFLALQ